MKATLYSKDRPLLHLDMSDSGYPVSIQDVIDNEHMPIGLVHTIQEKSMRWTRLKEWFEKRHIPNRREEIKIARRNFHNFEYYYHMPSLSDQYWLKHRSDDETWKDINYFTNTYSTVHGDMFFTPWTVPDNQAPVESPDLTTNGVLIKRWKQDENNVSYLYKAGSKLYKQEPLSEVLASIVLQKMNLIPILPYTLEIEGMRLCSRCQNFITADTEYVPAIDVYNYEPIEEKETNYEHYLHMCEKLGIKNAKETTDLMIGMDVLIGNKDRHYGNFGFIRDVESGKITGFAPLFDNGQSFWGISGTQGTKKDQFKDERKRCLELVLERINKSALKDVEGLIHMVKQYPGISSEQKAAINEQITNFSQNLEVSKVDVLER
ncbi:MAG: hypothetical protein Q4B26_01505 [Eubacteriales bacterium]|nr:hypothetical protein [Eubacteriales bacterium]